MVFNIENVEEKFAQVLVKGVLGILIDAGLDEVKASEMVNVMLDRLTNGMHWLPMTPDAVFEDGGTYLLREKDDCLFVAKYDGSEGLFFQVDVSRVGETREFIKDYARITEPK
jgi:hypothetical protein